jgi:formate C-acetyltransferase
MTTTRVEMLRAQLGASPPPDALRSAASDSASVRDWAEPFHDAWAAGEGPDPRLRLARAQAAEMAAARPFVRPAELIVGNNALRPVITSLPSPFASGIRMDLARLAELRRDRPEAGERLAAIEAYWTAWLGEYREYAPMTCHASLAWERALEPGLDGLRDEVRKWAAIHRGGPDDCGPWYEALLVVLDGISAFIEAHAGAAERAASAEPEAARRAELLRIAAGCRHVAHGRPRTFLEAAQLFYLLFYLCGHDSPGPIDRYLYPALRRNLDAGTLTLEQAQEIVDCLWLKLAEKTAYGATLGGQLRDRSDATNDLSFLCLSAVRRLRLLSPRTAVRWHHGLSPRLFEEACACVADGASFPAFVNDEAVIPAMVERGVRLEDAREYTFGGCGQVYPHGRGHGNYEDVVVNGAKLLELALNDGVDPMTGERAGPPTGGPASFAEFPAVLDAVHRQTDECLERRIRAVNEHRARTRGRAWDFLRSLLTGSCVVRGRDWHDGGADYSEGMVDMVGMATVTDSLVAIRRAVFDERRVTLAELVEALNRNWQGAEELRQYLLHRCPKFGNEDPEADGMAAAEVGRVNDVIRSHRTVFGGPWGMDIIGWSFSVSDGERTGATPDGRRRGEPIADCAGPAQGRNVQGLTATLNSALRLPHGRAHGPLALRVSLKPSDSKAMYGCSFSDSVAEADVAEASKSAQDGLGSW